MPSAIVTDNWMSARERYPNETIVANISDVLRLADGTAVTIHQTKIGRQIDGPCHAARVLIENGKLLEAE